MADDVNASLPINLKNNYDLVERIYERYPFISKSEISKIVINVFESFRDFLIFGDILNINNFLINAKLHFFDKKNPKVKFTRLKVKVTTPPKLRKI